MIGADMVGDSNLASGTSRRGLGILLAGMMDKPRGPMAVITCVEDLRQAGGETRTAHVLRLRRRRLVDREHLPRERKRLPGDQVPQRVAMNMEGRSVATKISHRRGDARRAGTDGAYRHQHATARSCGTRRGKIRRAVHVVDDEHLLDRGVAANTAKPFWFQLYVMPTAISWSLIYRAKAARCSALMVTVDLQISASGTRTW